MANVSAGLGHAPRSDQPTIYAATAARRGLHHVSAPRCPSTSRKVHARITVFAAAEEAISRINATVGVVEKIDQHTSVLVTGADSIEIIAVYIGMLGIDFHVAEPPELVAQLALLGLRYARSVTP